MHLEELGGNIYKFWGVWCHIDWRVRLRILKVSLSYFHKSFVMVLVED
jgi:hypothetical protein